MLKCSKCGCKLEEKDALVHKDQEGKENAKQTFFAVLFCLAATIYAFVEKGPMYGGLGIVLTILVYIFASKAK